MFDLKGHLRLNKALYVYLFSSKNFSVKPTLPLMLPKLHVLFSARFQIGCRNCNLNLRSYGQLLSLFLLVLNPSFFLREKSFCKSVGIDKTKLQKDIDKNVSSSLSH